jgi:two-component system, cell cycle sensor histidine kinase and response regulator CckA
MSTRCHGTSLGRVRACFGGEEIRSKAKELLRETEEQYRRLFETAKDGIAILHGKTGAIEDVNPFLLELMGYRREELLSKRLWEIGLFCDMEASKSAFRELQAKGYVRYDNLPLKTPTGKQIDVEFVSNVYRVGNRKVIQCNIRDISARRRAEEESELFQREQIRETQKLESLGVLAGSIAHDFNNLLVSILGHADLASSEAPAGSPLSENIRAIEKAGRWAADLCSQLLTYSSKGRFQVQPLDLAAIVSDMTSLLAVSVSKKTILRYTFAAGLPSIAADAAQMRQLVMNLVINASEAIGNAPGVISVRIGSMTCDREYLLETWHGEKLSEGRYVYFEVSDTGCGMSAETQRRMFEPFFTTKFAGRGLGLATAQGIIWGHRGAIRVYSELGTGSTFRVLFPAVDTLSEITPAEKSEEKEWRGHGTILLVDDEEGVRTVTSCMLKTAGFAVLMAEDGGRAVEMFKKHAGDIVGVVLDLTMPVMDGVQTFRQLRHIRKDVRVLLASGYNEQQLAIQFSGKGFAGFMHKPFQRKTLVTHLRNLLDEKPK